MDISEKETADYQKKLTPKDLEVIAAAKEVERKKGFLKDLGWYLLGYTLLFSGMGLLMIYGSSSINPYCSIIPFSSALLLDVVCIVSYIQYPDKKHKREP